MDQTREQVARAEPLLRGVLSPPQPGRAGVHGRHTVVVSAGLHRAVTGAGPAVDALGCAEVLHGSASDSDPDLATLKARMEALERYASVAGANERSTLASAAELGASALPLHQIPRHDVTEPGRRAGSYGALGARDRVRWVPATRCGDGAEVFVPTVMAFNVPAQHPGEQFWVPVSTGTAAHLSWSQALENALLEVVERDAVALTWLLRTPGRRLPGDSGAPGAPDHRSFSNSPTADREHVLSRWDITSDLGVPTVLSVLSGPDHRLRHVVGAAARMSLSDAAEASSAEAAQIQAGLRAAVRSGDRPPGSPARCRRIHDGALFTAQDGRANCFSFLSGGAPGGPSLRRTPPPPSLDLVQHLTAAGHDAYAVDLTPPDVAVAGLRVVRAIVPSLQPLSPVFAARYLASARLRRTGISLTEVNPLPYPLA